jgi:hypothetical protein
LGIVIQKRLIIKPTFNHGISYRLMAIHARTKKILAATNHYRFTADRILDSFCRQQRCGTIRLHAFLKT